MRFFRNALVASLMYVFIFSGIPVFAESVTCWFPPGWANKKDQARLITNTLSKKTGLFIKPKIAKTYPFIVASFTGKEEALVYVGSFVQAIIKARGIGVPLVQADNGKKSTAPG